MSHALVVSALRIANEAVAADREGNYSIALQGYEEVLGMLDSDALISELTRDSEKQKVVEIISWYSERIDALMQTIPEQIVRSLIPEWKFSEVTPSMRPNIEPFPTLPERRPFWLMRNLSQTMISGGYITSSLYIPRDVWYQSGAKFTAFETQYTSFDTLLLWLQKLKELDLTDLNALLKDLEEFGNQLDLIQNSLARKFKFIPEIKNHNNRTIMNSLSKQVERMHASYARDKIEDDSSYIKLLVQLLTTSQFLDGWFMHFETLPETQTVSNIKALMKRICAFMHQAVCGIIVNDLRKLIQRHLRKNKTDLLSN